MKLYITFIVFALCPFCKSFGESLFFGPLEFKGLSEGTHFNSPEFTIDFVGGKFKILGSEKGSKHYWVEHDNKSIRDLVFSQKRTAIALAMTALGSKKEERVLLTIDVSGKRRAFTYESSKMNERFGWIIELGAVSDNGQLVLAKCARMLPPKNGISYVRYQWLVLSISPNSIKVIDSINAIDKWSDYVSKMNTPTKKSTNQP